MPTAAILGTAGYTGQETLDRVLRHPELTLAAVGSDSLAGENGVALDPRLVHAEMPPFVTNAEALATPADVTILCLSHEAAAALDPPDQGVVVDLSGAHRLHDPDAYERWYGFAHPRPESLGAWVYGLTELVPETGRLVANPGCYATATLLALGPIKDAIDQESVVVDGLSGMTGAGRSLKPSSHAGAVLENVSPYRVGAHQHVPEIAQLLGFPVSLTPHLLPVGGGQHDFARERFHRPAAVHEAHGEIVEQFGMRRQ
jgi:N-acetyl-gamma-glutamyl-phosphate reductase